MNNPARFQHYRQGRWEAAASAVIGEAPVALTVNGAVWLTFMCTPTHLEAQAVGFLFNEGVIDSRAEVADVRPCATGENVDVWLHRAVTRPTHWTRTSGCTGGATQTAARHYPPIIDTVRLSPEQVSGLITQLLEAQDLHRETGGVHASALSDGERLLLVTEDIGRHNTLDKIAGRCLLEGVDPRGKILLTTGRVSSEMLGKAARLRASAIISRTSPTSLSVQIAEDAGVTLIGYARRDRFTVYAHPERLLSPQELTNVAENFSPAH